MSKKILIVEDEFIEASNLERILQTAGYEVIDIAMSVREALKIIRSNRPDIVLLDIFLKGPDNGIVLAAELKMQHIPFVYLSANSNPEILARAKKTEPYGFLVKPFREKDVLIMLDIAHYLHEQKSKLLRRRSMVADEQAECNGNEYGIVGDSAPVKQILQMIKTVAPADTTVLISGESGTGKERIVDNIHRLSKRKSKPLIKVNCAALPGLLIESELFGHERGAFTGAFEKRIGKFEQASGGTIFLDEIGEMPAELQVKLLRVLQEKEIERVGGKGSISIDVRVVAATNRNLEKEVAEGRFRMDLYYRLNVFPLLVPPLRERKEDIPLLVSHFTHLLNARLGKEVKCFSEKALNMMIGYSWPGNIRELEHLVERSMLIADGNVISHVSLPQVTAAETAEQPHNRIKTMEENDADHIIRALQLSGGKLAGPGGAAELLGLPYSTLVSKIKRLGINRENVFE